MSLSTPLKWADASGNLLRRGSRLSAAGLLALTACSAAAPSARPVLQFIGDDRFRYVSTASVLNPLNDNQGEHWRLVQLDHRLRESGFCRNGYDILSRTPPRSYGSFTLARTQYWTGDVVYLVECKK